MKLIERLVGNSFYLFLSWLSTTLISFMFWIVVWKTLPPSDAGIITTSINVMILLSGVSIFGMSTTLNKLISEYSKKKSFKKINSLINFSNKITFSISIAIALVFFFALIVVGFDLKIPLSAVIIVIIGIFLWPFVEITNSILMGFQNMRRVFQTNLIGNSVKIALVVGLVLAGFGFLGPLIALLFSLVIILLLRRDIINLGMKAKVLINKKYIVLKYTLPAFFSSIGWVLFANTPVIILTLLDSLHASGIFSATVSMSTPLLFVSSIMNTALFPIISSLMISRKHAKMQGKIITSVVRYISFLVLPLLAIYVFFTKGFILVFASLQYLEAVQYLPIVGLATVLLGFGTTFVSSLFAIRKTEASRNIILVTAASFITLAIPLTLIQGIMGLLIAYLTSISILTVLSYFILRKILKFIMPWRSIGKIFIASALLFLIMLPSELLGLKLLERIPLLIFGIFVYLLASAKIGFFIKEDSDLLLFLKKKIPILKNQIDFIARFISKYSNKNAKL